MSINFNLVRPKNPNKFRSFSVESVAKFNESITDYDARPVFTETDPDLAYNLPLKTYNRAFNQHFPLITKKNNCVNNPWYDRKLTELMRQKDKCYKIYICEKTFSLRLVIIKPEMHIFIC